MKTPRTRLTPAGRVVVATIVGWILLCVAFSVSGCDVPLDELPFEAAVEPSADEPCNSELRDIVEARFEQLDCLAECDAIMLECLDRAQPECSYCEHPRAVCASNCPGGAIAQ